MKMNFDEPYEVWCQRKRDHWIREQAELRMRRAALPHVDEARIQDTHHPLSGRRLLADRLTSWRHGGIDSRPPAQTLQVIEYPWCRW